MGAGGEGGGTAAKRHRYCSYTKDDFLRDPPAGQGLNEFIGEDRAYGDLRLTGQEAKEDAGPAVVLSFIVSGVSAMLSVFCYIEFAVEIPVVALHHNC